MPDPQKIVALPSGERIAFPSSMADDQINTEIRKYLTTKGGTAAPAAPAAPSPGPIKRFATQAVGIPENTDTSLKGNIEGAKSLGDIDTWINALKQGVAGLNPLGGMADARAAAIKRMQQPGQRIKGGAEYLMSGVPYAGPAGVQSVEQATEGDWAGSTGSAVRAALLSRAAPEAAKRFATGPLRVASQAIAGVGKDVIDKAAREHAQELSTARGNYNDTVQKIQNENKANEVSTVSEHKARLDKIAQDNAKALADYKTKIAESRAKFEAGQKATTDASRLSSQISNDLPKVRDEARADAKAAYPKVQGTSPSDSLLSDLKETVDTRLRGTGRVPSSLARVMREISPEEGTAKGPSIMGKTLDLSDPTDAAAYRRFKDSGAFTPEEISRVEGGSSKPLDFDTLHGMYSELGREAFSRDLPGDERAALIDARSKILANMTDLAKTDGKLPQFQAAQRGWQVLENTFYNDSPVAAGGSPIARALRTADPVTGKLRPDYVRAILSDSKAFKIAQELLGRYGKAKGVSDVVGEMKGNVDTAKTAPKKLTVPAAPEPTPTPAHPASPYKTLPKEPEGNMFDPVAERQRILQNKVPGDITPGFMWYRQALRALMRKMSHVPSIQDYLSQNPK